MVVLKKCPVSSFDLRTSCFLHGTPFFGERTTERQTTGIQIWGFSRYHLLNEQSHPVISRITSDSIFKSEESGLEAGLGQ